MGLVTQAIRLPNLALRPLGFELQRVKSHTWQPRNSRFLYFQELVETITDVPGDIVECGVGNGRTLFWLGLLTEGGEHARRVWGFDSFEGLPPPHPEDQADRFSSGKIKAGMFAHSEAEGRALLLRNRISPNRGISRRQLRKRFVLVPGFFPESFPKYSGGPIALLHLDVNIYQSYKDCLEYFEPKVAIGGVVAFDEYEKSTWVGATRAIEEYYGGPPPGIRQGEHARRRFVVKQ
jgi:O-methyltransferase